MKTRLFALVVLLGLMLSACGHVDYQHDFSGIGELQVDEFVQRPDVPNVYVHPQDPPPRELTAIVLPFRMRQSMENSLHYGAEITRIFWQTWLKQQVFPALEFVENAPYRGREVAVTMARNMGADLAIGGEILSYMAGGSVGTSQVTLRVDVYEAYSGALIWSMEHSGLMQNQQVQDYIFFRKRSRLPTDPTYAIIQALAQDMAMPVRQWHALINQCPEGNCPDPEASGDESEDLDGAKASQSSYEDIL